MSSKNKVLTKVLAISMMQNAPNKLVAACLLKACGALVATIKNAPDEETGILPVPNSIRAEIISGETDVYDLIANMIYLYSLQMMAEDGQLDGDSDTDKMLREELERLNAKRDSGEDAAMRERIAAECAERARAQQSQQSGG